MCFPSLLTHLISSYWQCAQPGQFCFILIAYFRLKKLVFLDYFDVEMGAGEQFTFIRQYVFTPPLFCANSRIPIYILAVELNYCKHLCGPARHNRLAGSCIMSVPPTGHQQKYTIVHSRHVWHQGLLETVEWAPRFFAGLLEYLLNESLMTGIPLPVYCYVHIPGINPIYLHIIGIWLTQFSRRTYSESSRLHL